LKREKWKKKIFEKILWKKKMGKKNEELCRKCVGGRDMNS
jgi:hypothetical protein